ncbi:ribosomal protein S12 methylthiotransferase RimO [Striga asiatica]|uniref:Ribosomal protein S12 methylthiotransferase RimO n=1 Tax=Striga asiatica TaxID=4170 RepID=A0A5A7Q3H4_STRAF|nr:ribosomal protein S12 methylthiotransferase RimO [Striga asiatica]
MANVESKEDKIHLSVFILWGLWKARNKWCFGKEWLRAYQIMNNAWAEWLEYEKIKEFKSLGAHGSGLGGCAWNDQRVIQRAWCSFRESCQDLVEEQLQAIRLALVNAIQAGWKNIKVYSDMEDIARRLNSREIIKTDVENFRELVQRLTGKPEDFKKADNLLSQVLTCRDPENKRSDVLPVLQETQMKKEVEEIFEAENPNSYLSFWREVDGFLQEPNENPLLSLRTSQINIYNEVVLLETSLNE